MGKRHPHNLSAILSMYFVLSSVLLGGALLYWAYYSATRIVTDNLTKSFEQRYRIALEQMEREADRIESATHEVQLDSRLVAKLSSADRRLAQEALLTYADRHARHKLDVLFMSNSEEMVWIDASSPVPDVTSILPQVGAASRGFLERVKVATFKENGMIYTGMFKSEKIVLDTGEVLGVVVGGTILDDNLQLLNRIKLKANAPSAVLTSKNRVVAASFSDLHSRHSGMALAEVIDGIGKLHPGPHNLKGQGIVLSDFALTLRGQSSPLTITFVLSDEEMSGVQRSYLKTLYGLCAVCVALLLLTLCLVRKLIYPSVRRVLGYAETVSKGELAHAFELGSVNELNTIGVAMEKMVASISAAHDRLKENEGILQGTLESTADGILVVGDGGELLKANSRFAEMWRVPEKLVEEGDDAALIHSILDQLEDPEGFQKKVKELYQNPRESFDEIRFKDGRTFERYSTPLVMGNESIGRVWNFRDITARKQTEEELRRKEENLRITLDSIGDAVIATDTDGNVTQMNPVAQKLTGWTLNDALGRPLREVFRVVHAQTRQTAPSPIEEVFETGEIVGLADDTLLISKDGSEYRIAESGAPIRSGDGVVSGVVLVFRDVTQSYALEERLRQSQKMEAIGQLAGGVAHDFNNMLGGILGAAELLTRWLPKNPKAIRYNDLIIESAERAAGLTEKLLAFARRQPTSTALTDLHDTLSSTVDLLRSTLDRRIAISLEQVAGRSVVRGDSSQLQNAILNLGINASQAMPDGGTISIITSNVELDQSYCDASPFDIEPGAYLKVEVRDTGDGISQENLSRVFEPFFTTKGPGAGTGLGLAAVFGTVQQHRGVIEARSTIGVGTTMRVLLPLAEGSIETEVRPPEVVSGAGRILVVDDEAVMRDTAKDLLTDLGYEVIVACNGREALAAFEDESEDIDLVILDMIMPEMNGRDCLAALRKLQPDVKVVLSSGFVRKEKFAEMERLGFSDFLRKPYRSSELSRVLHDVMNSSG